MKKAKEQLDKFFCLLGKIRVQGGLDVDKSSKFINANDKSLWAMLREASLTLKEAKKSMKSIIFYSKYERNLSEGELNPMKKELDSMEKELDKQILRSRFCDHLFWVLCP